MSESELIEHVGCPHCPSSDAYAIYDDGHAHCFSCGRTDQNAEPRRNATRRRRASSAPKTMLPFGQFEGIPERGIKIETCEKFGYFVTDDGDHVAPYRGPDGKPAGQKVRGPNKQFLVRGSLSDCQLFGQHLWKHGGKRLLIVEGELDALAASQMLGSWPVVSIPQGAQSALKAVKRNLEFVESYETVVIGFDMDEPGRSAAREVADLLTPGRALVMELPEKDACDMLVARRTKEFVDAFWEARPVSPAGIVNGADLWDEIDKDLEVGIAFPWSGLTAMTYGQRRGELYTWCSGSGMGKSAFVAEIAYDLLMKGETVGYVALEENVGRTGKRIIGLELNRPIHLPDVAVSRDEKRAAFERTLGTKRFWMFDHFGSMASDAILSKLRYLAKGLGCGWLIVDHVSIIVSGMDHDDERKAIDRLMTDLRSLVEETHVGMHLVSHLRRPSERGHEEGAQVSLAHLRGSHAIAQLSDMVIGLERNQQDDDEEARNVTRLRVIKNRFSGDTGSAGLVRFDKTTGRLSEIEASVDMLPTYADY